MALEKVITGKYSSLSDDLATVANLLRRSTVQVSSGGRGDGSGVIWTGDGLIVTNAHVARTPLARVKLWDGRSLDAAVRARDPERDLAALKVEAADLTAAPIADSDALRPGQLVVAMGNPLGVAGALTLGAIHALGRRDAAGGQRWIQADVRLAPGNSGGPLADSLGRVIGVNTMVSAGLAMAIPSKTVADFLSGAQGRPYLGVTVQPVARRRGQGFTQGLLVLEVERQSPAESAGVVIGDLLMGSNGQLFAGPFDLASALSKAVVPAASGVLPLDLVRGCGRVTLNVALRSAISPTPAGSDSVGAEAM